MITAVLALLASPAGQKLFADILGLNGVTQEQLDVALAFLKDPDPPTKGA